MTTKNKIEANRRNAQKSTGPRTPEGKAKSSQNAVTHGLCSARPVLAVENKDEFDRFANDFIANLSPLNPVEEFLSRRIACLAWRLQRAARYETLVLDNLCKTSDSDPAQSADEALGRILTDDFRDQRTLEKIQRYETQLERSMLRCTKQLRVLRDTNLMNYSDIRQYVRGYQPRDPFFKDSVDEASVLRDNNQRNEPNLNVDEASLLRNAAESSGVAAVLPNEPKSNVAEASCFGSSPSNNTIPDVLRNEPKLTSNARHSDPELAEGEESLTSLDSGLSSMDSLQNEPTEPNCSTAALGCGSVIIERSEESLTSLDSGLSSMDSPKEPLPKDWAKHVLDKVHYPRHKQRRMSQPKLNELADSVLMNLEDPEKFLRDIAAEQTARQQSDALAAVAC